MAALGFLLLIIGGLAHLLPQFGLQLKLVKAMQAAHPQAVQYCLIAGSVLFVLGLLFPGRASRLPDVGEVVPDEEEQEKGGGPSVGGVLLLLVVVLLGVGAYLLQTKHGTFDPVLKAAHEGIQKWLSPNPPAKSS
ncbi:MAG: hypothetical protein K2W96_15895 [Gemmataceae bacterium]|nr:hypothetical protein [Gemmataceae bacterium]